MLGIVEEFGCSDEGEAAAECQHHILVDAALDSIFRFREHIIRVFEILQNEIHAVVKVCAVDGKVIVKGEGFPDDRYTCITLDEQEIRPGAEEIDLSHKTGLGLFRHLRSLFIDVLKEVIHPVNPLVGTVPDIEDGGTGIVGLAAFLDVHYIVGIHISGCDVAGRGTAVAEITLVGDTSYVTLLIWIGQNGVERVHIGLCQCVAVENGILAEFVKRFLVQETVVAGYQGESRSQK